MRKILLIFYIINACFAYSKAGVYQNCTDGSSKNQVNFTFRGLMAPVFTPLNSDESINYMEIPAYAEYLAAAGIKGVLVGGTSGEGMSFSVADRMQLVDEWVKVSRAADLHIQVQVGGGALPDVLRLARYCAKAGVHSLLSLPELYFKPQTVDELVAYVALVASAAPNLPVLYYHYPAMSKVDIKMPAFVSVATKVIPNFKGIKFTSNDLSEAAQVLENLNKDQEIFLGADTLLAPGALLGIRSSVGTGTNLFPRLARTIMEAVENGDVTAASALQRRLSWAMEALSQEGAKVPVMKAGMEVLTSIKVGPPALPQKAISANATARIATKLKAMKFL